jgi:TonB-linked SusC/RagA family outer membrane protein
MLLFFLATEILLAQNNQTIQVTGKVTEQSGEPVVGGSISQKGTSNGTITDLEGSFNLNVPQGAVIVVQYLGYITQELTITNGAPLAITLLEDFKKIDEVIVIGYGTRQRKSVVGAIEQIGANRLEDRPVGNAMQALQGAAANLIIQQRSMNPNDNTMNINIRGISTMNNNDPLVVVDGIITELESLNRISPDDIANISVLKDAGSAAIYGSRSSNGVILVTTKQGSKNNRPSVRFNSMVGYENPKVLFNPVKGYENALLRNQAEINSGNAPAYAPEQIRDLYEHRGEEDWFMNQIMQSALQQSYNVSIAGGGENSTYMVSGGFFDQGSNFVGDDYGLKRYNFRTNVSSEYGRFKLTTQIAYNRIVQNAPTDAGRAIIDATRIAPSYLNKMKAANGRYLAVSGMEGNSLAFLEKGGFQKKDEDNIIGNVSGELEIITGLKAKGLVGIDLTAHHRFIRGLEVAYYAGETATEPQSYTGTNRNTEDYNEKKYTLNTQFMLDYDRTFNAVNHVSGLLGVSNESYTREANEIKQKYTDRDLGIPAADGKTEFDPGSYNTPRETTQRSIYSVFGRAFYSYADKYYGEASFRYDGSSKFLKGHRWGFFPSFSAGWRLSQESFMDFYSDRVGDLKIRGSYGVLGNQNVDDYSYFTTYTINTNETETTHIYGFNNKAGSTTGFAFGNKELRWEKSANFNIGFDASFLKDQLYVSFDYFNKTTSGILLKREPPRIFGGAIANENAGKMENRGWELTLNYRFKTQAVQHRINLNIADSKNKVVEFGDERILQKEQMSSLIREGEAFQAYYGYKTDGFFNNYEEIANSAIPIGAIVAPGDVKYVNYYPDDVIDDKDRQVLGNAFPRYTFGFNYDVNWKGFDLGVFFQGVGQRAMVLRGELMEPFHANYSQVIYEHQLDFWSPTNTDARWPRLTAPGNANNYNKDSELYLLDAAYLRLKNIQLGYTLPASLTAKFGVQKLRVSVNAQNLWTLTKNSFIDPESTEFGNNMGGVDGVNSSSGRNYPTLIYYGFGLNLEF